MQPSTTFGWGRVVTPARWIATILGIAAIAWTAIVVIGGAVAYTSVDPLLYVSLGLIVVGVAVAFFWRGIGEVVGGLALVGSGIWSVFSGGAGPRPMVTGVIYALAGVLFVACGWYSLAQRRHHAPPATA
jgi:hypothetical protein